MLSFVLSSTYCTVDDSFMYSFEKKGGLPASTSYINIPKSHISTEKSCFLDCVNISGARYSSVPQKVVLISLPTL